MTHRISEIPQATAARLAGLMYLIAIPLASFSIFYVWPKVSVARDATRTASNIISSELLFRVSIVTDLMTWAIDLVLILSLYVLLRRVNRDIALLAVFFRLVETAILAVTTLGSSVALLLLIDADHLKAFEPDQLHALAKVALSASGAGYDFGLIFVGIGSSVFSYLLFRSGYVPRLLAGWGIFSSMLLSAGGLAMIVFPGLRAVITPAYFTPVFIYELTLGIWLLVRGAKVGQGTENGRESTLHEVLD